MTGARWAVLVGAILVCACANYETGSGGVFYNSPSKADVASGRADYKPERFASFKVGQTTKREVMDTLGKPDGWLTKPDKTSSFSYAYVGPQGAYGMRSVVHVWFYFDDNQILTRTMTDGDPKPLTIPR
jgi:hypothetical protein